MNAPQPQLSPQRVKFADIGAWLRAGWQLFLRTRAISLAYAGLFCAIGAALLFATINLGFTPMAIPLAGAFMLVAPILLCGFFSVADRVDGGETPRLAHLFDGFRRSPPGLWVLALVCTFLFLVWLTDAATVYSLYFGTTPSFFLVQFLKALFSEWSLISFLLLTSAMGATLALVIFTISAFAVPLLFYRRTDLAGAVGASVRAVFANFPVMMGWALLLSAATFASILVFLPAFVVVFPVLAYASKVAYRAVYPG